MYYDEREEGGLLYLPVMGEVPVVEAMLDDELMAPVVVETAAATVLVLVVDAEGAKHSS